jgi:signal transduction histidine kinase
LLIVGAVPLFAAGAIMLSRAERTALDEVRAGNHHVAESVANRLGEFVTDRETLLQTAGAMVSPATRLAPEQIEQVVRSYQLIFPQLESLDVVLPDCREVATLRIDGVLKPTRCGEKAVDDALAGKTFLGPVHLTSDFKDLMTIAVPLEVANERIGAAIAEVDMIDVWSVVGSVRVGQTGRARLIADDGTLIAHGDPEERRNVFIQAKSDPFLPRIRAAAPDRGAIYQNSQHQQVIALAASVPGTNWTVIVEQPVAEAFRGARIMRTYLVITVGIAILLALLAGVFILRSPVVALEEMRQHAKKVAEGDMDARVRVPPAVLELRSLANGLNEMTADLKRLQEEIKSKERLSTFARVAAGLAHDLQLPIEHLRSACDLIVNHPDEPSGRELLKSSAETHLPKLHRYVRDLRRLAHDGKIPLEYQSIDPRALAEAIIRDASGSSKWRGVEFQATGKAARVWCDEGLLVRAVTNLVGNAADACTMRRPPSGSVTINVRDDGADLLVIEVKDTGVGIEPQKLHDLMVNDFRSDKRASGVGLGLGVARHVASAHGGTITAESELGVGTTFRINLPRQSASGVSAERAS